MRILFFITGYKCPEQFDWLFNAVYNDDDMFLVHIDRKSEKTVHDGYRSITGHRPNVYFMPSRDIIWSGTGLLKCELQAMEFALKNDLSWRYLVNLTAQDYPLVSMAELRQRLADAWPFNFVQCNRLENEHWRIRKRRFFRYIVLHGRRYFTPMPVIIPSDLHIRWSGAWWHILSREFCTWLLEDPKPQRYLSFLSRVGVPDEFLIQNIIQDSPFRDFVVPICKHAMIWRYPDEPVSQSAHPHVLCMKDLPVLTNSDAFFARKFDETVDRTILELLAAKIKAPMPLRVTGHEPPGPGQEAIPVCAANGALNGARAQQW